MWVAAFGIWAVVGGSAVLAWSHPGPGARVTAAVHGATAPPRHESAGSPAPRSVGRVAAEPPVVRVQPVQTPPVTSTHTS